MPEWLAELRDPLLGARGDPQLLEIAAPEHIPTVLKAFGQQPPPARRHIVFQLDGMAATLNWARENKPPMKFASADAYLNRLENATVNLSSLWANASPFYRALSNARFIAAKREKRLKELSGGIGFRLVPELENLLGAIRALRDPDIFADAFLQPGGRKRPERALLWEPLFDLMSNFNIKDFHQHQDLIVTVRALHLACGIAPPEPGTVRQAHRLWKEGHR